MSGGREGNQGTRRPTIPEKPKGAADEQMDKRRHGPRRSL